jgi:ubiquinone/menaquinone biosynthesis C-methylase UbiE
MRPRSDPGLPDDVLVAEIRQAYGASVDGWATGPAVVYRRLATALVDTAADELDTGRVLDLGSGTGVASAALLELGAQPIGLDLAVEMLQHHRAVRPPGVAGDAQHLPFRTGVFDAIVAAFSLNHVPDLGQTLTGCRRVLRRHGLLVASTFPSGDDHPAKAIVERVLEDHGYRRPAWYGTFKARVADLTGDPDNLASTAGAAGFASVRVEHVSVEVGLDDPHRAVEWRLNMPHTLAFVAGLDRRARTEVRRVAIGELTGPLPSAVRMLVLHARTC